MKQKRFLAALAALVLLFGLAALPAAASDVSGGEDAAEEGSGEVQGVAVNPDYNWTRFMGKNITLNVYNWGEYMSLGVDGEGIDVNAEFEALTGIRVNYTVYDTNENMYAKLNSGGASYDIIIPSDYMIGKMANEDMLLPLNYANIPNYQYISPQYLGLDFDAANTYSVPYTWGYVGIIYNKTMVNTPPTSWDALWDKQYQKNILMFDNSRDAFAIALLKMHLSLNPALTADIDAAKDQLLTQKDLVQAYVMDQIFDKMEGGEAAIAPYYAGDAITMMDANPDLGFAIPSEGTNIFIDSMCIPKGAKNQEAAEMYINFLCEPQVAKENSLFIGYSTPNTVAAAEIQAEMDEATLAIAYPDSAILDKMEAFNVLPEELNRYMDEAWASMRSGSSGGLGWMIPVALVIVVVVIVLVVWRQRVAKKKNDY